MKATLLAACCVALTAVPALGQEPLPAPDSGGAPLMQALRERASSRAFAAAALSPQQLADVLWAATGVNRRESGKRTAPSALDRREVEVYAVTAGGAFRYDPAAHALVRVAAGDLRAATGAQPFVATAPLNLVYVVDYARLGNVSERDRLLYPAVSAGAMVQNVYLYAASSGLATVVRAMVDREALGRALQLRGEQEVIICQTVGWPADT